MILLILLLQFVIFLFLEKALIFDIFKHLFEMFLFCNTFLIVGR